MGSPQNEQHGPTRTIYINTVAVETTDRDLTFEELVDMAEPGHTAAASSYVITYGRKGPSGMEPLMPGQSVKPKDGMTFDVFLANRS